MSFFKAIPKICPPVPLLINESGTSWCIYEYGHWVHRNISKSSKMTKFSNCSSGPLSTTSRSFASRASPRTNPRPDLRQKRFENSNFYRFPKKKIQLWFDSFSIIYPRTFRKIITPKIYDDIFACIECTFQIFHIQNAQKIWIAFDSFFRNSSQNNNYELNVSKTLDYYLLLYQCYLST